MRTAKLQPVFAAASDAAGSDERHARERAVQIDPEKHNHHGHLLAASGCALRFCHDARWKSVVPIGRILRTGRCAREWSFYSCGLT